MKVVYKYELELGLDSVVVVSLPKDAELLHVDRQNVGWFLWALIETGNDPELRYICMAGTGHDIKHEIVSHINSFIMSAGLLVFHAFEVVNPELGEG